MGIVQPESSIYQTPTSQPKSRMCIYFVILLIVIFLYFYITMHILFRAKIRRSNK